MLHALLAGLVTAGAMASIVVLSEVVSPAEALGRLTPVVVGTLDLSSSPTAATFALSNMAPGDRAVRSLTITNGGTLPFRYAMETAVDDDASGLTGALQVVLREAVGEECVEDAGAVLVPPSTPRMFAFGSRAWGRQQGDRRLEADSSEVLCFFVELPLVTRSDMSDASAALTFTFHAEEIRGE